MKAFTRWLAVSVSLASLAACGGAGADNQDTSANANSQPAPAQASAPATAQANLPAKLCELFPKADAERIMGKALVEQRNDDSACHYRDAKGTTGTGVMLDVNILSVSDQCRLITKSEPLSGVGSEACIAIGQPAGLYTTLVFSGGGRTFEATAPGQDKASELATAVAKVVLSKLPS